MLLSNYLLLIRKTDSATETQRKVVNLLRRRRQMIFRVITVRKFDTIPATQILREISSCRFKFTKTAFYANFRCSEFGKFRFQKLPSF